MADPNDVDDTGAPETPVKTALEKKKTKNLTYAAIAIGAIGVVLMIVLKGKSSSGSGTASTYGYPSLPGGAGGSGVDSSALQNLASSIQAGNTANQQANAGLLSAIAGLRDTGSGGTPADQSFAGLNVVGGGYAAPGSSYGAPPGSGGTLAGQIEHTGAGNFSMLGSAAGFEAAQKSGQTVYYQPAPGKFLPWAGSGLPAAGTGGGGTPGFLKL